MSTGIHAGKNMAAGKEKARQVVDKLRASRLTKAAERRAGIREERVPKAAHTEAGLYVHENEDVMVSS